MSSYVDSNTASTSPAEQEPISSSVKPDPAPAASATPAVPAPLPTPTPATATTTTTIPAVTVVNPGPRAQKLSAIYTASLAHTSSVLTPKNMKQCFPTVHDHILSALGAQLSRFLTEKGNKEFVGILQERDVVAKLNSLDGIVDDAARRRKRAEDEGSSEAMETPPHALPATAILRAHLGPHYIQAQSKLNAKIQTAQSQNEELIRQVEGQRREVEALLLVLEGLVRDLEGVGREVRRG